jgi:SH3 domain protein
MKKIVLITLAVFSLNAFSATVYITDEVDIPIRSDKTFEDNIIRSAPSGTKLKILKTDSDGWTQVKFEKTTGWVISRYLSNNPPARIELKELKITDSANKLLLKKQQATIKTLEKELKKFKESSKNNEMTALKAKAEKRHIEKTYAEALEIEHENTRLKQINLNLKSEVKLLKIGDEQSIENSNRIWFLYGGIVMFFGVFIGFLFSRRNKR